MRIILDAEYGLGLVRKQLGWKETLCIQIGDNHVFLFPALALNKLVDNTA